MRRVKSGVAGLMFGGWLAACGGGQPEAAAPNASNAPGPTAAITLEKAPESGQVDKVGQLDGAKPDGANDYAFLVSADGAIKAVFLVTVDETGRANGRYQADTLIGDQEVPKEVSTKWGKNTAGLAVAENGTVLNAPDGSIPPLAAGPHKLTLYISSAPLLTPGTKLRVHVQRPDGSVDSGATLVLAP